MTTDDLTPQMMFDKALHGVIAQGHAATQPRVTYNKPDGTMCAYKTQYGSMCAIGHVVKEFIPEDHAFWDEVGDIAEALRRLQPTEAIFDSIETMVLLALDIQEAHDNASIDIAVPFLDDYKCRMQAVAREWDLEYSE